jgi:hypothetical protein
MRIPFTRRRNNHKLLKFLGGAVLAVVGARMVPDIMRYIKITRM